MTNFRFPLFKTDLSGAEKANVDAAFAAGEIGPSGRFRDIFEAEFAKAVGSRHVLTTSSGTTAIVLALDAAGIKAGDEVILPSMTYIATANAVLELGAIPVFADVDPDTWCLDPARVAALMTDRTRAILIVHLYGNIVDHAPFRALAAKHDLVLCADAAHACQSRLDGQGAGAITTISTYSFHLNKTMTCGEGGAVAFNDDAHFHRAQVRRSHGMDYSQRGVFHDSGYNFRLSNLACAILVGQMARMEDVRERRAGIRAAYRKVLCENDRIGLQSGLPGLESETWFYPVVLPGATADVRGRVMERLERAGIETRTFFPAIHHFSFYHPPHARNDGSLQVTNALAQSGMCLPCYNTLTPEQATEIAETLCEAVGRI